jgi:hypothetical protein
MQDFKHIPGSSLYTPECIQSPFLVVMLSAAKHLVASRARSFAPLSTTTRGNTQPLPYAQHDNTGETHNLSQCSALKVTRLTRHKQAPDLYTRRRHLAANSPLAKASLRHIRGPSRIYHRDIPCPHRCIEYR